MGSVKFWIILIFCLAFFDLSAQKSADKLLESILPPGCNKIGNDFFIDQIEVSNIVWLEFLAYLKANSPEQYLANLPDTTVWTEGGYGYLGSFVDPYYVYYLSYPGFRFYPVVGVSYEQVLNFCAWRSNAVTEKFNLHKKRKFKNYEVEFSFRLPTKAEWEQAARSDNDPVYGFSPLKAKDAKLYPSGYPANYKKEKRNPENASLITEYVYAYPRNTYGLYNMIGNVAEMVADKGIAKGGSWTDKLEDCAIDKQKTYTAPTAWLGFRCVCTVALKPLP
ncbi:MAG: SUMF1/EgtB/PvdO family nonheme iron enzyme [Microscillaceae bacterium]|nr:SUMF1/EgtB/PvdO family nonheme iron enzyme [Microscillaceae bacterium]